MLSLSDLLAQEKLKISQLENRLQSFIKMPNMNIVLSIINFLKNEAKKEKNADTKESLEVAVQCLQTAYDIDIDSSSSQPNLPFSLEEIFACVLAPKEKYYFKLEFIRSSCSDKFENILSCLILENSDVNDENKRKLLLKAECLKNMGNTLMRSNMYSEAAKYYSQAIEIDSNNAVYYCNRAAAYSKLNNFHSAIQDCEKAVQLDPMYAKAYGRMGLAYNSLDENDLAIEAFKKALELEPDNDSYQSNMKIALDKKQKIPSSTAQPNLPGLGSVDWQTLFSNPAFKHEPNS
ncbi:small glutamine-rich tetratricopeptide repeat-containing protein beta [Caerostris extrusa]|uniref:Small glutamine-rich tetratricopeptide repeat-containing protein beta n=1 Tax=Caerostris extrusa TaxID=172846 RepID=A0AAV4SUM0_CAEEX|nr:small glutamine-rich tetratricopeptide repeat-containing protein beta [Caerostris extrusa]